MTLSNRLTACCQYVRPGDRVADIGCDHGYLGIHLLQNGIAQSVIAADVKEQPLQSAMRNALKYSVRDQMTFYLSDGMRGIPRDFDCAVCAGMGGDTIISILEGAPWLKNKQYRLILQCQSRRPELRKYLYENGWQILRETLAQDGKFIYPIMEVIPLPAPLPPVSHYYISPALVSDNSPLLPDFCRRVIGGIETTVAGLRRSNSEKLAEFEALLHSLKEMEEQIHAHSC